MTVVYPPQAPASNTVVLDRSGGSVTREYDQYGQEINRQPAAVTDSGPQRFPDRVSRSYDPCRRGILG